MGLGKGDRVALLTSGGDAPGMSSALRGANSAIRELASGRTEFMAGGFGPSATGEICAHDPYVVLSPLADMLAETTKLHQGNSPLARWRKRSYAEVETILDR